MDSLYWLLRWARPAQVCLTGCPGDGELLLIAAAVADAGGKRLVVETPGQRAAERLWPLVASAGLDWLVRFEDNASNQPLDCRILANPAAVRTFVASDPEGERRQARLLIGLGDGLASKAGDNRALEQKLNVRGFHAIIPPRPDERFWAAVHVEPRP